DVALQTRLHYRWQRKRQRLKNKRPLLSIKRAVFLVLAVFALNGCRPHRRQHSVDEEFSRVQLEFEKGDLETADKDADLLAHRVSGLGDDWIWRVRLLKAEILVWRGLNDDALKLLTPTVPESLAARNYSIRRLVILGLAQGYTRHFDEAKKDIQLAE